MHLNNFIPDHKSLQFDPKVIQTKDRGLLIPHDDHHPGDLGLLFETCFQCHDSSDLWGLVSCPVLDKPELQGAGKKWGF